MTGHVQFLDNARGSGGIGYGTVHRTGQVSSSCYNSITVPSDHQVPGGEISSSAIPVALNCHGALNEQPAALQPHRGHFQPMGTGAASGVDGQVALYQVALHGWRRHCFYTLLSLVSLLVVINSILTIWIMTVITFSPSGMGKLRISAEGRVTIPGDTFLLKEVYANSIKAPQNSTLRIVASNEIQIKALSDGVEDSQEHGQQRHTNDSHLLTIGPNTVESYSNQLVIRDVQGNLLMLVNDDHVAVTANKLRVNNPLGIQFNCSLQAPSVELLEFSSSSSRTSSNAELKVQSLTRKTRILGPKSVSLDSKSGSVRFTSLRRLSLMSKRHQIALKASWVEFRGLRTALPTKRGRTYPGIRQLCLCPENGILFVAPAAGHCIFDKSICESPMDGH